MSNRIVINEKPHGPRPLRGKDLYLFVKQRYLKSRHDRYYSKLLYDDYSKRKLQDQILPDLSLHHLATFGLA